MIIHFQDVTLERQTARVLDHLNWTVQPGENWAILGLNGAGKTTMLKLLHGDLWPSNGQIEVLGQRFGQTSIPALTRRIGWVSSALQDWLRPGETAERIVLSGKFASIGLYEQYRASELATARSLLAQVGGSKLIGRPYGLLSQGERQAVMIARALMTQPELLVLDEPCNGLDLFAREKLLTQVAQIAQLPNPPALLMVSHYPEEILPCFNRVLLLKQGRIFAQGPRDELLTETTLQRFYGTPVQTFTVQPGRIAVYPQLADTTKPQN